MRKPAFLIVTVLTLVTAAPWPAWGQYGTAASSYGSFGSRTIGQAMGGASRSFSGSGLGTGIGSNMGMGIGMGGGSPMGMGGTGMGTNSFGNTQYRFATRRQGDFVGTDSRDVNTRILGGLTGTSGGSYNTTGSTSSPYGTAQSARQAGSSSYRRSSAANRYGTSANSGQILVGLDATFDRDLPSDPQVSSAVKQRLVAAMRLPAAAPVEVLVQGNTAVLRGAVATPHDRALAERLVLLEPGIGHVMNELQVERSGATLGRPQPSPAGQFRPSR